MNREQIVRDTAYAIWEAEGKPDGRSEEHWRQAEARVAASLTGGEAKAAKAKATTPAKGKATDVSKELAAKPPAKAAATKKVPIKKTAAKAKL
jgi:hypothetical protein